MKIVSNTGPIIGLAKIGLLFLLNQLASEVIIPPTVRRELLGKTGSETEQIDKALNEFLKVADLKPLDPAVEIAISSLDEGEKEVIGLASTMSGDVLLLIDDRAGRDVAKGLNISLSGVVGILLVAREKGMLEKISPLLEELRDKGYWLSDEVLQAARRVAGEI
jgi:predicted nucleic acid-binding protein